MQTHGIESYIHIKDEVLIKSYTRNFYGSSFQNSIQSRHGLADSEPSRYEEFQKWHVFFFGIFEELSCTISSKKFTKVSPKELKTWQEIEIAGGDRRNRICV